MNNFITNNILTNLINFCAPVVGIALVIFCLVQAFKIFTGNENAAGSFQAYGELFKGLTDTIINKGAGDAGDIIGH